MESEEPSDPDVPGCSYSIHDQNRKRKHARTSANDPKPMGPENTNKIAQYRKTVKVRKQKEAHRKRLARATADAEKRILERSKFASHKKKVRANERPGQVQSRLQSAREYSVHYRNIQKESISKAALTVTEAEEYTVGEMSEKCKHCGAKFFQEERVIANGKQEFNFCCLKGNLRIENPFSDYPVKLKQLFERNSNALYASNFHDCVRSYNSALAFGSMKAKSVEFNSYGPYCYKIHGQIYHTVNLAMHPDPHEKPSYAQLFIIDTAEATAHRMSIAPNASCSEALMAELDRLLRYVSPYYHSYLMMKEIEDLEARKAKQMGQEPPELKLLFGAKKEDQRRYNMPRANEVASIFVVNENGELPPHEGITVHQRGKKLQQILKFDKRCDSMIYPLFFPTGKGGWNLYMRSEAGKKVTMAQYYRYLFCRRGEPVFSPIHYGGKLFQQFLVDAYVKVEQDRLDFIRKNQKILKVESYKGLTDYLKESPGGSGAQVGKDYILPSSFTGSPRNYQQRYQDSMAIVRKFGKPDLFLTFTANKNWQEIQDQLKPGQTAEDAPDIICRVFRLKVKQLLHEITKRGIFGKCVAYSYSIEYQKRGTPHCHMLLILAPESKVKDAANIDKYVWASLPDKDKYPRLRELVENFMIHGPCGKLKPNCGCMEDGKCRFNYPKQFKEVSEFGNDSYANYRRSDNGDVVWKQGIPMDNRSVVPYNPYLLTRFGAHLNVELCASVKSVKYLYKYVYKGFDAVTVSIEPNGQEKVDRDEIKKFVDMRYVTPHEAFWRLSEFDMYGISHTVRRLGVHMLGEQVICFDEEDNLEDVVAAAEKRHSTLTAYLELNRTDENARKYLYHEIPEHYTFKMVTKAVGNLEMKNMKWVPRGQGVKPCIGRIYCVNPKDEQSFYLRVILLHKKGAGSFKELRTVNGVTYEKFKDAAKAMGLIGDDRELENCLKEASEFKMASEMRKVFATILTFCGPKEPQTLWTKFRDQLSEDFSHRYEVEHATKLARLNLEQLLNAEGTSLSKFGIDVPEGTLDEMLESIDRDKELALGEAMKSTMNRRQKEVIDKVFKKLARIENGERPKAAYYIDGIGGSGKTYTYKALCHLLSGYGKKYMSMAYTGCAAQLLPSGKTLHKTFELPVPMNPDSLSRVKPNSKAGKDILATVVFILDEAPMCAKYMIEAVDKKLKQLTGNQDLTFGGKVFLLSGDFRQVLPVKKYASKTELISLSLKNSYLMGELKILKLKKNMRALPEEKSFARFLLKLGNGELQKEEDADVSVPPHAFSKGDLTEEIFGECIAGKDYKRVSNRAILCTTNDACKTINDEVLNKIDGEIKTYYSRDTIDIDEPGSGITYPDEFVHSLDASGLPLHELKLKENVPLMLLRNLNVSQGLTNGTRLLLKAMKQSVLICEIISGEKAGETCFIPRIKCTSTDGSFPFTLTREQFPVRLCYSLTINKSQGSTFDKIGLNLELEPFAHGLTYVAMSRVRSWDGIKIKVAEEKMANFSVKNIVWRDALLKQRSRRRIGCNGCKMIFGDPHLEQSDMELDSASETDSKSTDSRPSSQPQWGNSDSE